MSLLEVKNLEIKYGKRVLLKDLSFTIKEGEFVGILGVNGAGKTSLLKALLNLIPMTKGEILFKNKNRSTWPAIELAKKMTYLEQNKKVAWPLHAEAVVGLGLYPFAEKKISHTQIHDAMRKTECLHLAAKPIDQLSGGEQTLVLLARALVSNPDLLLMDEPISNLDPRHELNIMNLLSSITAQKKTVITVLHSLSLAAQFCTRIILLHEGQIFADGKPEDVLTSKNLKDVYGIEAQIEKRDEKFFVLPWKQI
jgi:iron complex transport system ATP-binding protein